MFFGPLPARDALGAILGHGVNAGAQRFRKGRLLSQEDIDALLAAGIESVYAARLGNDDMPEDEAAALIAKAACGDGARVAAAFTGRANLYAEAPGLLVVDTARVDALNLIDEAVTIATLPAFDVVEAGQMLATVKIIPFAAPRDAVQQAAAIAAQQTPLIQVAPFRACRAGLVLTRVSDTKDSVLAKTETVMRDRLRRLGSDIAETRLCAHDEAAIAAAVSALHAAGHAPILVVGGSAIVDRRDVVPAGIIRCGGVVEHFGMPVDPGNLLLIGRLDDVPVLGVPGCARSPKLNGFDWVLQRLCAGLKVSRADIMRMGAGGLLKEIPTRPMPRDTAKKSSIPDLTAPGLQRRPKVGALILAAGLSSRMQGGNKLLADLDGKPILRHVVEQVLASEARPIVVVTGHMAEQVRQTAGSEPDLRFVHNQDYAQGLATSLVAGLNALPDAQPGELDGVLVCLGDMPDVSTAVMERLIAAFNPTEGRAICLPVIGSKWGNPVLWGAEFLPRLKSLSGDNGARKLLAEFPERLCEVACDEPGILNDIDTAEALAARRQTAMPSSKVN